MWTGFKANIYTREGRAPFECNSVLQILHKSLFSTLYFVDVLGGSTKRFSMVCSHDHIWNAKVFIVVPNYHTWRWGKTSAVTAFSWLRFLSKLTMTHQMCFLKSVQPDVKWHKRLQPQGDCVCKISKTIFALLCPDTSYHWLHST